MNDASPDHNKSSLLSRLIWLMIAPLALGFAGAFGIHWFQMSQTQQDFTPYRSAKTEVSQMQPVTRAYSYIATPTTVAFGEIENYKRYRTEWDIVNSGLKTLELELDSHTCEVEFDGKPMPEKFALQGQAFGKIAMTWVVTDSEPRFQHDLLLKTNDDVQDRRQLQFRVHGTITPAFDITPAALDFGTLATSETKELSAQVVCYKTKNFAIDGYSLSEDAARAGLDVQISPLTELTAATGNRIPASGYEVKVTARGDTLPQKPLDLRLMLQSNVPDVEGLGIQLKIDRQ